ncbi:hypothetical protein D3C84_696500 [compost metagenome]
MADPGVSQVQHTQLIHPQYHGRDSQRVFTQIQRLQIHQITKLRSRVLLKPKKGGTQVERCESSHLPNRWRQYRLQHIICIEPTQIDAFQVKCVQIGETIEKSVQALPLDDMQARHRKLYDFIEANVHCRQAVVVQIPQVQSVTEQHLAGQDSIDLGRALLPDAHQFVAQFGSHFTLVVDHVLQQFGIVRRHLLRTHPRRVIIAHREKIHVHVIDIQHGLVNPVTQIGMQLPHLERQAIQQRQGPGTRRQE